MRIIFVFFLFVLVLGVPNSNAQTNLDKYWVFFTDKEQGSFDPYTYFDPKAIERRIRTGVPINDPTDWPVKETYLEVVSELSHKSLHHSRWFNAHSVLASPEQIKKIKQLDFVKDVKRIRGSSDPTSVKIEDPESLLSGLSEKELALLKGQTARMEGDVFHDADIRGQGMRIAVFDAGFPSVDVHAAFKHIRDAGRILNTRDFLTKKENVYKASSHGTSVLSCIAGIIEGQRIGLATEAEFLLARTESGVFEPFSEEENWLAAAEWADKLGADMINSSLGYTTNRYFQEDMDGKTSLVSRAANMAARKGMLVLNAAGNDGSDEWKFQGTPADADSVLSIGGISFNSDFHISFSSYGPTSDKRMKPNICAFGVAMVAGKKGMDKAYGTSFASPLATGFAACAWQTRKESTNMEMFDYLQQAGELHPYFDYAHGFGVPRASYFVNEETASQEPTFDIVTSDGQLKIEIDKSKFDLEGDDDGSLLYYHLENAEGYLDKYYVVAVHQYNVLQFHSRDYDKGITLRIHYQGYTSSYTF